MKYEMYPDELKHFGVKGMKWGIRRKRAPGRYERAAVEKYTISKNYIKKYQAIGNAKRAKRGEAISKKLGGKKKAALVGGALAAVGTLSSPVVVTMAKKSSNNTSLLGAAYAAGLVASAVGGTIIGDVYRYDKLSKK